MFLYKYKNYEEYIAIQMAGNKQKRNQQWARKDEIQFLSNYLLKNFTNVEFGICHGTRQGNEQKWFFEYTKAKVIGTDIGDTAEEYPNTIRWDFNKAKPEWIDNVDFIYSNSFDHTIDPETCLKTWMSCVKNTGCCILEWSQGHTATATNSMDPFGASLDEYKQLIHKCGFKIKDQLKFKSKENVMEKVYFVIIK